MTLSFTQVLRDSGAAGLFTKQRQPNKTHSVHKWQETLSFGLYSNLALKKKQYSELWVPTLIHYLSFKRPTWRKKECTGWNSPKRSSWSSYMWADGYSTNQKESESVTGQRWRFNNLIKANNYVQPFTGVCVCVRACVSAVPFYIRGDNMERLRQNKCRWAWPEG